MKQLQLTEYDLNVILNALIQQPFKDVAPIVQKLVEFRDSQTKEDKKD